MNGTNLTQDTLITGLVSLCEQILARRDML